MKIGLLWFDNDTHRDLTAKISRAAKRYREKYGIPPNTCYVHKSCLPICADADRSDNSQTAKVGQIQVIPSPSTLLHHFWIGQEEQQP